MNEAPKQEAKGIKHNHGLMMLLCCGIPLVLLITAIYFFGLSNKYIYWIILLSCPLMHFFMMKDMHKRQSQNEGEEKGKCH